MSHHRLAASAILTAVLFVAAGSPPVAAQEFFVAAREFVVDRACDATRAIRTRSEPTPLEVGKSYAGRGLNRTSNATHAFIRVGDRSKWVELGCGHFADGAGPGAPGTGPTAAQCLPFFDAITSTVQVGVGGMVDITPEPPTLDAFDTAITATCGAPGKVVPRDEFKAMLRAHPAVLERIKAFTAGKVYASRPTPASSEAYLADLTDAWFAIKAFDHIFCGEPNNGPSGGKIGGLHFHGRYAQLQQSGDACRMNNLAQNEVVPGVVYTLGVSMKNASGRMVQDAIKGYGLTLSGEDIIKAATRAFGENPTASLDSTGCLLPVRDDGRDFKVVFVRRATGIRTFYPDATPNGRGDRINPPCAAEIRLQN